MILGENLKVADFFRSFPIKFNLIGNILHSFGCHWAKNVRAPRGYRFVVKSLIFVLPIKNFRLSMCLLLLCFFGGEGIESQVKVA